MTPYGSGAVNLNTASREALSAVGLSDTLVERVLAHRAGQDKIPFTGDDLYFSSPETIPSDLERLGPVPEADRAALEAMASEGRIGTASQFFSVRSVATLKRNGAALEAFAVIDRKGKVMRARLAKPRWPSRV